VWLLAACGSSKSGAGSSDLTEATQRIAQDYQAGGDLAAARTALASLDAPNPNQLLVLAAENTISAGDVANGDALVRLALALDLNSNNIERYARARGLFPQQAAQAQLAAPPTATPAPANPTPPPAAATDTPATNTPAANPPAPDTPTPAPPTATPVRDPEARTQTVMNVRGGPGTNYPVVGALKPGDAARITVKNPGGDWWQVALATRAVGWVYAPLVETSGDTGAVAVAEIPTPPPATATPVPPPPADTPTPEPAGVDFRLVEQHLWDVEENGGHFSGDSVNCGDKQELHVVVLDAAGNRLNGVTVRGVYRNEYHVTGEKGPGMAQYDVNVDGDDIVVAKDVDGREVTSDVAKGLTAKTYNIPQQYLIQGRFCSDAASCDAFIQTNGCFGHFSWTVTFQRTY